MEKLNNFAYIDGNNLYRGVNNSGWKIDFFRFRRWLTDKYHINRAYYFIGLIPKEKNLYTALQEAGFTLVFKEVVYNGQSEAKRNCDADLVLQAAKDVYENSCDKLVLVTSDGDYACLVKFLQSKNKIQVILSPGIQEKCSILLKRTSVPITYLNDVKNKISLKVIEKAPIKDGP
ncbi:NYN domain-containing protein [Patescibacteria group bacterium]|nr:NYN domain-containing protein [Patescibacteria group bacterium]